MLFQWLVMSRNAQAVKGLGNTVMVCFKWCAGSNAEKQSCKCSLKTCKLDEGAMNITA
jgi:hypothetical protein